MATDRLFNFSDLVGRILLAALFLWDGWIVAGNYGGTVDYLASHGLPAISLPAALVVEVLGGIMVVIGWWTRLAALAIALFCVSTALMFHANSSDMGEQIMFWKDLAIAGGFLVLSAHGAGAWSLDHAKSAGPAYEPGRPPDSNRTG
jgi:putative oxidoreductase